MRAAVVNAEKAYSFASQTWYPLPGCVALYTPLRCRANLGCGWSWTDLACQGMVSPPGLLKHDCKVRAAMRNPVALRLLSWCAFLCIHVGGLTAAPSSPRLLQSLRPSHPHLLVTASELERVCQMIQSGLDTHAWYANLCAKAEKMINEPTVAYKLIGLRLLALSRPYLIASTRSACFPTQR
jgi:hypothetical protein